MTLEQVGAALALAMSLGGLLGGAGYWFTTHRSREANATVRAAGLAENIELLKEQNGLLRAGHDDAHRELTDVRKTMEDRGRRIVELEKTMKVLEERVTQRAAVDELAGALSVFTARVMEQQTALAREIAELKRETAAWQAAEAKERAEGRQTSAQEHQALADVLERIAKVLPKAA